MKLIFSSSVIVILLFIISLEFHTSQCYSGCALDCNGRGECLENGQCECEEGYFGNDCGGECKTDKKGLKDLKTSFYSLSANNGSLLGYIEEEKGLGYLSISITPSRNGAEEVEVWISKDCYPDPSNLYFDYHFISSQTSNPIVPISMDCRDAHDDVIFFVLIQCPPSSPSCSFSVSLHNEMIAPLHLDKEVEITLTLPSSYYSFSTSSMGYTVQITSYYRQSLSIYISSDHCATQRRYEEIITTPTVYESGTGKIYRYSLSSSSSPPSTYYILVVNNRYREGEYLYNAYKISATNGYCPDHPCAFGLCSSDDLCNCYHGYSGPSCQLSNDNNDNGDDFQTSFTSYRELPHPSTLNPSSY